MTDTAKLSDLEKRLAVVESRLGLDPSMPVGPIAMIVRDASSSLGLQPQEVIGTRRHMLLIRARFAVAWAASEGLAASLGEIGLGMGDRDHTTILNALRRARRLRETDDDFRKLTDWLLAKALERKSP